MFKSESIAKLAAALVKAQSQMGNAVKDSKNPYFKSKYADLNSIREASLPALNANGISVIQPTVYADGKSLVETILLHESGEWISGFTEIVAAKANDPQATGSGISYARRYGLQSMLNVGAEDDDSETAMGRGANNNKAPSPVTKAVTASAPTPAAPAAEEPANVSQLAQAPATKRSSFRKVTNSSAASAPAASADDGWDA